MQSKGISKKKYKNPRFNEEKDEHRIDHGEELSAHRGHCAQSTEGKGYNFNIVEIFFVFFSISSQSNSGATKKAPSGM